MHEYSFSFCNLSYDTIYKIIDAKMNAPGLGKKILIFICITHFQVISSISWLFGQNFCLFNRSVKFQSNMCKPFVYQPLNKNYQIWIKKWSPPPLVNFSSICGRILIKFAKGHFQVINIGNGQFTKTIWMRNCKTLHD